MTLSVKFVTPTGNGPVDSLLGDFQWAPAPVPVIHYHFTGRPRDLYLDDRYGYSGADPRWNLPFREGFRAFDENEQAAARAVLALYENIIGVKFVEVDAAGQAALHFSVTDLGGETAAGLSFAPAPEFFPFSVDVNERHAPAGISGDIWLDDDAGLDGADFSRVLLQEIGHALGLSQPQQAGFKLLEAADTGLDGELDYIRYTVMSLRDVPASVSVSADGSAFVAAGVSTPMPLDILALQSLYGAALNETDDVYIVNAPGVEHLDPASFSYSGYRAHQYTNSYISIVDNGGHNALVIPLENDLHVDLHGNAWSSTGGGYVAGDASDPNLFIADGTIIHELITGAGHDTIFGNDLGNSIFSYGGDDTVTTGTGNDLVSLGRGDDTVVYTDGSDALVGGSGDDVVEFAGRNHGHYRFTVNDAGVVVIAELAGADVIALAGVETLVFGAVGLHAETLAEDLMAANAGLILAPDEPLFRSAIGAAAAAVDAADAQLYRMYYGALGRAPDAAGFGYWSEQFSSGAATWVEVAAGLIRSQEFQSLADTDRQNGVDNDEFIDYMYANVPAREPDESGYPRWAAQLDSGGITQAEALIEMTRSDEFVLLSAASVSEFILI